MTGAALILSAPRSPGDHVPTSVLAMPRRTKASHRVWPGKDVPVERGVCRWCGADILRADGSVNRRKTFCDQRCVKEYLIRADPKVWRRTVYNRDMGICRGCGEVFDYYSDDGWQADHILPLFVAHARGDWTAWDPDNGQVLCDGCHKDKTQADFRLYGYPPRWPEQFKAAA